MKRRVWLLSGLAGLTVPALAQQDWARVAVPIYAPADLLQGLYGHALQPLAQEVVREAQALAAALATCGPAVAPARTAWVRCMLAWERLSAVAVGPLITRRSLRAIDFQPTRPALIQRALAAGPGWDLALVGTPAKGLPALEWLLWAGPRQPVACAFAQALAQEIVAEAVAVEAGFAALARQFSARVDNSVSAVNSAAASGARCPPPISIWNTRWTVQSCGACSTCSIRSAGATSPSSITRK